MFGIARPPPGLRSDNPHPFRQPAWEVEGRYTISVPEGRTAASTGLDLDLSRKSASSLPADGDCRACETTGGQGRGRSQRLRIGHVYTHLPSRPSSGTG